VQHDLLLARLAPEDRTYIRRILQAPVMDPQKGKLANSRGTPQGGLCKALHSPPYAKWKTMQSKWRVGAV
jgi:RNA-directed DNA polymerase